MTLEALQVKIKRHDKDISLPVAAHEGEWIDLETAVDHSFAPGEYKLLSLGVSIKLPEGYEAILAARSSTFKKYGILPGNGIGVIDEKYCGENDIWHFPALATTQIDIKKGTRLCQFRIQKVQPKMEIIEVENMEDESRGGFGSTGD